MTAPLMVTLGPKLYWSPRCSPSPWSRKAPWLCAKIRAHAIYKMDSCYCTREYLEYHVGIPPRRNPYEVFISLTLALAPLAVARGTGTFGRKLVGGACWASKAWCHETISGGFGKREGVFRQCSANWFLEAFRFRQLAFLGLKDRMEVGLSKCQHGNVELTLRPEGMALIREPRLQS